MNTAEKIDSAAYPPYRRHSDRVRAVNQAVQQVEREHADRRRRLLAILLGSAALLFVNGLLIVNLI